MHHRSLSVTHARVYMTPRHQRVVYVLNMHVRVNTVGRQVAVSSKKGGKVYCVYAYAHMMYDASCMACALVCDNA